MSLLHSQDKSNQWTSLYTLVVVDIFLLYGLTTLPQWASLYLVALSGLSLLFKNTKGSPYVSMITFFCMVCTCSIMWCPVFPSDLWLYPPPVEVRVRYPLIFQEFITLFLLLVSGRTFSWVGSWSNGYYSMVKSWVYNIPAWYKVPPLLIWVTCS